MSSLSQQSPVSISHSIESPFLLFPNLLCKIGLLSLWWFVIEVTSFTCAICATFILRFKFWSWLRRLIFGYGRRFEGLSGSFVWILIALKPVWLCFGHWLEFVIIVWDFLCFYFLGFMSLALTQYTQSFLGWAVVSIWSIGGKYFEMVEFVIEKDLFWILNLIIVGSKNK